ncbi:unnamed protein product [Didymodactylos carnosus]|uniref:HTH CENPB-type domain-containing protein n=1 Tax=Didymodactylos carnosus TaxID=1234261 RepID=A0A815FCG9_9BILA|nr:unnamed protein product [Didymodactylos carnosus]CAF1428558.1 unnamed protein product [Didymodactylos carnosus]CAF4171024.1 unnamed protein product [Didymodactylos carnosus]CAF4227115.1 unnamed protein product [Didymodactylos carnosus]
MNLVNIAKHLLHLTKMEFGSEDSTTSADEIFASQQLFEILKSFKDSCFSESYTDQTLDFHDEYDEIMDEEDITDEEESNDEEENIVDYDENQSSDIQDNFTLEEMEDIVEWVDQHPNYKIATIKHYFRKVKLDKLKQIKEFMWDEFYMKRAIEKEAVHDSDLELFAIQKSRELGWNNFKASSSFIKVFKREYHISSRRYNKLITRISSTKKICTWKDAYDWIEECDTLLYHAAYYIS